MRNQSVAFVVAVACTALAGCADGRTPLLPIPPGVTREIAPDGGEAPNFNSIDEVPEDLRWAIIRNATAAVFWDIETVDAIASMDYWANRASMDLKLIVTSGYSTVGTKEAHWKSPGHLLARPWRHGSAQLRYTLTRDCGQTADLRAEFDAQTFVLINWAPLELDRDHDQADDAARQPDCEEDQGEQGGGTPGGGGSQNGGTCLVYTEFYEDTGEIIYQEVLYCH